MVSLSRRFAFAIALVVALGLSACKSGIGERCETEDDCAEGTCGAPMSVAVGDASLQVRYCIKDVANDAAPMDAQGDSPADATPADALPADARPTDATTDAVADAAP